MIVFHGLPCGMNVLREAEALGGRHVMVSFGTAPTKVEDAVTYAASVALDNGAFTAWRGGRELDVEGFWVWAAQKLELPSVAWFLAPDAIDGDERANDDLLYSCPRDLRPWCVPVFHLHESLARLKRLCWEYPRVALGSSGPFRHPGSRPWWERMGEVFAAIPARSKVKIHGLRMVDPRIVARCPFASVDSTTAGRHANAGIKFPPPFNRCEPEERVRAYASYLERTRAPIQFLPPERTARLDGLFDVVEDTEEIRAPHFLSEDPR